MQMLINEIRTVNDLLSLDFESVAPERSVSDLMWQAKAMRAATDVWKETLEEGGAGTQVDRRKRLLALQWVAEVAATLGGCRGNWPVAARHLESGIGLLGIHVFPDEITKEFVLSQRDVAREIDSMARDLWLRKRDFDHAAKAN